MRGQEQHVQEVHARIFGQIGGKAAHQGLVMLRAEIGHEPQHVAPPAAIARRVRIALFVAMHMMFAVVRDPGQGRAFARQAADQSQQAAKRLVGLKTAVGQLAMVAHANADAAGQPDQNTQTPSAFQVNTKGAAKSAESHDGNPDRYRPVDPQFPGSSVVPGHRAGPGFAGGFGSVGDPQPAGRRLAIQLPRRHAALAELRWAATREFHCRPGSNPSRLPRGPTGVPSRSLLKTCGMQNSLCQEPAVS